MSCAMAALFVNRSFFNGGFVNGGFLDRVFDDAMPAGSAPRVQCRGISPSRRIENAVSKPRHRSRRIDTASSSPTKMIALLMQLLVANGQPISGIGCDAMEGSRLHIHQHLTILDRGTPVPIPADVGQVRSRGCLYWIHTHTPDGIIHIEAPQARTFTLGDFFHIWGQPLGKRVAATAHAPNGSSLHVWVNGKPYVGDPSSIPLDAHTDIVIQAGPPFVSPPRFTSWGTL